MGTRAVVMGLAVVGSLLVVACAPPSVTKANDLDAIEDDNTADETKADEGTNLPTPDRAGDESDSGQACLDECTTAGERRCAAASTAATEECKQSADGCLRWVQSADCAEGTSCDTTKNDGTCKVGCVNDAGCSADTVGQKRCTTNNTAEQTCSQAGACFVFKTTRTGIPQECSTNKCVAGQRNSCVVSQAGACTAHELVINACPTGQTCTGQGVCSSTCTNDAGCSAATEGDEKCASTGGRGKLRCTKVNSCYKWTTSTSCAPDEKCSVGQCVTSSCTNQCTLGQGSTCPSSTTRRICVEGASGCTEWKTLACASGQLCSGAGVCKSGL